MGESKLAAKARSLGRQCSENEYGIIVSQIRRYLSTAFIRAQSMFLLNRLCYLGDGAQAAAGRRNVSKRMEEARSIDRQAHYQAHIRGRGLSREGQLFVA